MKFITDLRIRIKLMLIILIITTAALIVSGAIFFLYDKNVFKDQALRDMSVFAQILSENNTANLVFNGKEEAKQSLQTLFVDQYIEHAILFKKDEAKPFAVYQKDSTEKINIPEEILNKDTACFVGNSLYVTNQMFIDNKNIGSITLRYSLGKYSERIYRFLSLLGVILVFSNFIALLLAFQFQKYISNPIRHLTELMKKVTESNDFSIRAKKLSKDETGILSDGFNQMLAKIEQSNIELKKAKDYAVRSLKVKERFLANMSHEIRTPLNAIIGLTNMTLETKLTSEQYEFMDNIRASSDNLLVIINDILDFSKLEAGRVKFEKREFDLMKQMDRLKGVMKISANDKNLYLNIEIEHDVPQYIVGDHVRLNQILLNLVGNAVKFTETGGIVVKLSLVAPITNEAHIRFCVKDTGIGIPKSKINTIFDSFSQASNSTTRKYGGTGLGLSITKQLVELQGGKISVLSEKGLGTQFCFELKYPIGKEVPKKKSTEPIDKLRENFKEQYAGSENINLLLVEDNKMNQLLAASFLRKNGFNVDTAEDGQRALEMHQENKYSIILMDLHMPKLDGYGATKIIRNSFTGEKKNVPIIAFTAAATKREADKCLSHGMTDYIFKPYKPVDLLEKILKIMLEIKE